MAFAGIASITFLLNFVIFWFGGRSHSLNLTPSPYYYNLDDAWSYFESFIVEYGKQYANDEEKNMRFEIFKKNLEDINMRNSEPDQTGRFGITQFSDLTTEQFLEIYAGLKYDPLEPIGPYYNMTEEVAVADSLDWRDRGVVTRVKNQGKCGSCWAFAATGAVESAYAIKHGSQKEFSEQQLVDCDKSNSGCKNGYPQKALKYLIEAGGQMGEQSYPYIAQQGQCRFNPNSVEVKISKMLPYNLANDQVTKQYLQTGPIAIALDSSDFRNYVPGGVLKCSHSSPNHAVLLIGYGQDGDIPYYIIKNSYGTSFGDAGFARIHQQYNCGMYNGLAAGVIAA